MSFKFWVRNIALHAAAGAIAVIVGSTPDIISSYLSGPTGGALQYAHDHPIVGLLYAIAFGAAREALKAIPGLAPQTATTVGPNAPAALGTSNLKS